MTPSTAEVPRGSIWSNPTVRALFYQALALGLVAAGAGFMFRNTLINLRQRGIASGFGFLANEAGFDISETLPVPRLQGGLVWLLAALGLGLAASWAYSRVLAGRGRAIGDSVGSVSAVLVLLVGVPAAVVYFGADSFSADSYSEASRYSTAFFVGLINTVKVALLACVLTTMLGLVVGMARLSSNWLISHLALGYIETIRNIPLLLQIFFWYRAVLRTLPGVKESITWGHFLVINNRGVILPKPTALPGFALVMLALLAAFCACVFWVRAAWRLQDRTGAQRPVLWPCLAALVLLPGAAWLLTGEPIRLSYPQLEGFNYQGGTVLSPEYTALLLALVMYTAAFIAEIVRSGIQAVSKGQREAAGALGLQEGLLMRLVILPQALRVMVPAMTSQYLNLTKNSSLGVAIAYPELVSVGGTILNQSGQAIEVIGLTMAVYLTFSLLISLGMNWYNARIKLVER